MRYELVRAALANVDVSSDPSIDHINIDKSPQLHARVVAEVLAVVGNHRTAPAKKGNGADAGETCDSSGARRLAVRLVPPLEQEQCRAR
jgi:hypothetical protein